MTKLFFPYFDIGRKIQQIVRCESNQPTWFDNTISNEKAIFLCFIRVAINKLGFKMSCNSFRMISRKHLEMTTY